MRITIELNFFLICEPGWQLKKTQTENACIKLQSNS